MRLHYHPASPYSLKVHAAILHRGEREGLELRVVNVEEGGLQAPEFLTLSPFGKMPVLEKPDGPLIESTSIIEYLEEHGTRRLLPPGAERVARHFDRLGDLYLMEPMGRVWWKPGTPEARQAPDIAAAAWKLFEAQLVDRPFVTGQQFTLGDLSGAIATEYLEQLGVCAPEPIRAWRTRCFETPGLARAYAQTRPVLAEMLSARLASLAS